MTVQVPEHILLILFGCSQAMSSRCVTFEEKYVVSLMHQHTLISCNLCPRYHPIHVGDDSGALCVIPVCLQETLTGWISVQQLEANVKCYALVVTFFAIGQWNFGFFFAIGFILCNCSFFFFAVKFRFFAITAFFLFAITLNFLAVFFCSWTVNKNVLPQMGKI